MISPSIAVLLFLSSLSLAETSSLQPTKQRTGLAGSDQAFTGRNHQVQQNHLQRVEELRRKEESLAAAFADGLGGRRKARMIKRAPQQPLPTIRNAVPAISIPNIPAGPTPVVAPVPAPTPNIVLPPSQPSAVPNRSNLANPLSSASPPTPSINPFFPSSILTSLPTSSSTKLSTGSPTLTLSGSSAISPTSTMQALNVGSYFQTSNKLFPAAIAVTIAIGIAFMLLCIAIAKYCAHRPQFADDKDYPHGFEVSPTRMSFAGATVFRSSKIIDKSPTGKGMVRLGSGDWNEKEQICENVWEDKPFVLGTPTKKQNTQASLGIDGGNRPIRAATAPTGNVTEAPQLMKMLPSTSPFLDQSETRFFSPADSTTTPNTFRSVSAPPPSQFVPSLPPPIFDPRPIAPPKVNYHPMQQPIRQAHFTPISSPVTESTRSYPYERPLTYGSPMESSPAPRMSIQVGQHLPAFIPRPPSSLRHPSPLDPRAFSPVPSVHSIRGERNHDSFQTPSPMYRNVSTPPPMPRYPEIRPFEPYSRAGPIERSLPPNNGPNKLRRGLTGGAARKSNVGGLRYSATMGGGSGGRVEEDRW